MKWIGTVGIIGSFLLLVKILIHIYIKRKIDKKFYIGASGKFLNPVLFLPIFDDVVGYPKALKTIGNVMYLVSIVLILILVIGVKMIGVNTMK